MLGVVHSTISIMKFAPKKSVAKLLGRFAGTNRQSKTYNMIVGTIIPNISM